MGNKLLISIAIVIPFILLNASNAEVTLNDIDRLVNDIKKERVGLKDKEILSAKDPFIYKQKRVKSRSFFVSDKVAKKRRYNFRLSAIVNDRAKINNKWYSLNSKIYGFKVKKIGSNYALLTKNGESIKVFLKKHKNKKIKLILK